MGAIFNGKPVGVHVNPCIKCGSTDINLWDCGYSSFNPGGGKCTKCGREIQEMVSCMPTAEGLASIWNRMNDAAKRLKEIEAQMIELRSEKSRLERMFGRS